MKNNKYSRDLYGFVNEDEIAILVRLNIRSEFYKGIAIVENINSSCTLDTKVVD